MNNNQTTTAEMKKTGSFLTRLNDFSKNNSAVVLFVILLLAALIFVPKFASITVFQNIGYQADALVVGGIAATFVLMIGGIDFSIGYNVGLSSVIFGLLNAQLGMNSFLSIVITLLVGLCCGIINGLITQYLSVPPFITTLGMGYILYGIAQILSNGLSLTGISEELLAIGSTRIFGLPISVYIVLVIAVIFWVLLHKTTFGRKLRSIGFNPVASTISGLRTNRFCTTVYAISGLLAATAGILMSIKVALCQPTMGGPSFTFKAIMGAVLGGASLFGGKGNILGTVLGVIMLTIISISMVLLRITSNAETAVSSIIILVVVVIDSFRNKITR